MSNVLVQQTIVTMTSLELVEYVNSFRKEKALQEGVAFPSKGHAKLEHSDFLKKVLDVLGERAGYFSVTFNVSGPNGATRKSPGYSFPKREACLMAMSYSYDLQAQVFDYMTELENKTAFKIPQTLSEALILAGQQMQLAEERQVQLELAKPKVSHYDNYVESSSLKTVTNAAKEMKLTSNVLWDWLRKEGHAFKNEKKNIWTKGFIEKGYGEMKQFTRKDNGYSGTQPYLTSTGDLFIKQNFTK